MKTEIFCGCIFGLIFGLVLLATLTSGCEVRAVPDSAAPAPTPIEWPAGGDVTVGNHSFIAFEWDENPAEHKSSILTAINVFEKENEVEIVSFSIEKEQLALGVTPRIYGIWVTHQPRQPEKQ